jgi:hypothetical protein
MNLTPSYEVTKDSLPPSRVIVTPHFVALEAHGTQVIGVVRTPQRQRYYVVNGQIVAIPAGYTSILVTLKNV